MRLAGIAVREKNETRSAGHPWRIASAEEARDALVAAPGKPVGFGENGHILVRGSAGRCVADRSAGANRIAAWRVSPTDGNMICAKVTAGWAALWGRYWRGRVCR